MLPNLIDYTRAFQNPSCFLSDRELVACRCPTDQLGQPKVQSGGFALTFRLEGPTKTWAVRCFHIDVKDRDRRYASISSKLNELPIKQSGYFVDFEYQQSGITINGKKYPIVKMAWATGETLGSFLEAHYNSPQHLQNLQESLLRLYKFLTSNRIAHGDIQPGNLMISDSGRKIQLIDYDGMFIPGMENLNAAETGVPNFQHPERQKRGTWNNKIDRFSFIMLSIALSVLEKDSSFWKKTNSSEEKILFDVTDYKHPYASPIFNELKSDSRFSTQISTFQQICDADFDDIPDADSYLGFKPTHKQKTSEKTVSISYQGNHDVIDPVNINSIASRIGHVVEIVGKIVEVKQGYTKFKKPYAFLNFKHWKKGETLFRLVLWSEILNEFSGMGISSLSQHFSDRYVSIVGMMSVFTNGNGESYQLVPSTATQIQIIDREEAEFRLGKRKKNRKRHFDTTSSVSGLAPTNNSLNRVCPSSNREKYNNLVIKPSARNLSNRVYATTSPKNITSNKDKLSELRKNFPGISLPKDPTTKVRISHPPTNDSKPQATNNNITFLSAQNEKSNNSYPSNSPGCLGIVVVTIGITIFSIIMGGRI